MIDEVRSFYDQLAGQYHLIFEDWDTSMDRQAAALYAILKRECGIEEGARILDCACGIGTQTLGLAQLGFKLTGCDVSPRAVQRAAAEAKKRHLNVHLFAADLLDLTVVPETDFDLIVCLDNALPHLNSEGLLFRAAIQIRQKLRRGATLIGSIRDYDRLVPEKPTVQGPFFYSDQGRRRIVHQVWDWINEREYVFHLYISQEVRDGWDVQHYVSHYRAVLREELDRILHAAGFTHSRWICEAESGFYQPIVLAKAN